MNPAWSVVFLTTLIGAAQGLFLALAAAQAAAVLGWLPEAPRTLHVAASLVALLLLVAGLGASFFHLGRPERAWRTATMWRTSWLSREVIVLPAFMVVVFLYAVAHSDVGSILRPAAAALAAIGALLAFALFLCTGMIYACVRFVQEWASPLTVVNFVLLGGASGFALASALAAYYAPPLAAAGAKSALCLILFAGLGRVAALARNARLRPKSTLATAIGIKHPKIEQSAAGFLGGSFNTREFFHGRTRAFLRSMKWGFLLLSFPLPLGMLAAGLQLDSLPWFVAACGLQYLGLLAERWYFFAEADHPQNLYYRAIG
ncbi:MAG: dimethyl sulfoxide reductase anchor subunit [Betaproteobacteria bacterium]|nr:dimethyl sulfoxide reductase anchor subunit [Betaproteobacteria bacterium]